MANAERHIFPGNNTPEGFFSYYEYILGQREANRIYCIKGGPGVGKSTFMKKIAEELLKEGEEIDFMHCSSDPDSIDGIVLKKRKIAMIDATAPHVVDPVHPGAVDSIIYLGAFWDENAIRERKDELMENKLRVKNWFKRAYNYLAAAGSIYDNLADLYESAIPSAEIYKLAAKLVGAELSHKEICLNPGSIKKYFASAITPKGIVHYLDNLILQCKRIYLIRTPEGVSNERLFRIFSESAVYRGINVEEYYCPMKPATKLEHLILPEPGIAFISLNRFHDIVPLPPDADTVFIDINDMVLGSRIESEKQLLEAFRVQMNEMIENAVACIRNAKQEHDSLETRYYIPNMDFKKIDALRDEMIAKIQ